MNKRIFLLVTLPFVACSARASDAHFMVPPLLRSAAPELLICILVTMAALVLACLSLRRSVGLEERARTLHGQLAAERESRAQSEQALADNHDVVYRLVRQNEDVRDSERTRIARELQSELGRRLLTLRTDLSNLHDSATSAQAPALASRLESAMQHIDGAIGAVRAVAGGLRGFGPGDGLRHALERCLAEHAHLYGMRYRFEAGIDPSSRATQDRSARLAVFRVLQDVLATAARVQHGELHVRLLENAGSLGLEIDGCASAPGEVASLPAELIDQIRTMGGVLRVIATSGHAGRWSLSLPVRNSAPDLATEMAVVA
ncbi:signal transduction histidine kinase [Massilia sp. MP_M2]|uniref:histidine kinase n=1 Tax=Massilia sp. MP_M2 TaxID=3071713 RepID=UPI00319DA57C